MREVGRYQFVGLCLWGLAALPPIVSGFPAGGPSLSKVWRQFSVIPRTTKCIGGDRGHGEDQMSVVALRAKTHYCRAMYQPQHNTGETGSARRHQRLSSEDQQKNHPPNDLCKDQLRTCQTYICEAEISSWPGRKFPQVCINSFVELVARCNTKIPLGFQIDLSLIHI